MATLPAGIKQVRTQNIYGTTRVSYVYKGARIEKSRGDWTIRTEYISNETGRVNISDSYASFKLAGVPERVEEFLQDENYFLDETCGVFRLTESRKQFIRENARKRTEEAIAETEKTLAECLENKDWKHLADYSSRLVQYIERNKWTLENQEVTV